MQVVVPLPGDNSAFERLPGIVEDVTEAATVEGLPSYVTGPGGQFADFAAAFEGIDGKLLFTTVGVILVILLLIYRSPVFVPVLLSAGLALTLAQAVVYLLAKAGVLTVDGQSQGILSVLVLGASTDYALLLISRFKEELHVEDSWSVVDAQGAARRLPADRGVGCDRHPRPALPAALRPQQQQVARSGRRHRHRLRGRLHDRLPAGAADARGPLLVLAVRAAPRQRRRPRAGSLGAGRRPGRAPGPAGLGRDRAPCWPASPSSPPSSTPTG